MSDRNRDKRTRADGTPIDAVKNLSEFVRSFPKSAEPEPQAPAPPASTATVPPSGVPTAQTTTATPAPEFDYRAEAERLRQQLGQTKRDLETQKTQAQIEATARRGV